MNRRFVIDDIVSSFAWLGHRGRGLTPLVAFHRDYKPGKEHFEANLKRRLFPKYWYSVRPEAAVKFVKRFYQDHLCCYGINPAPKRLTTPKGMNRRACDADIELVTNFYLDIDPAAEPTDEQVAELEFFLERTGPYFADVGINNPTQAFTGRGYHLLFAVPPISVLEHPDIKERLNYFRQGFHNEFQRELSGLELKLDNTMDLSRLAKIYGTKKPTGLRVSRFYGGQRKEDMQLKEHLLSLDLEKRVVSPLHAPDELPETFKALLKENSYVKNLWNGEGKTEGDTSPSGYDFSLVKKCLNEGITDIMDLAAILKLRPKGDVQTKSKGDQYVRLTIANAIKQ
jgi:hypothetical protein